MTTSNSTSTTKTWLITGCSSGFGLHLARTALRHGHNVVATSRNPSRTPDLVKEIESSPGGHGAWLTLDVCWTASQIASVITEAQKRFGELDVIVNNAAYSVIGSAEEIPEEAAKRQFESNFWGAVRVSQAVLPIMREQRSGTIVNISSVAGLNVMASASMYAASKFALEAWSEGLAIEVAQHGIRVLIVEPGAFRTNFLASNATNFFPISGAYKTGPAADGVAKLQSMNGTQAGDALKAAQRIFEVVERGLKADDLGKVEKLRLLLGKDCLDRVQSRMKLLQQNFDAGKADAMGLEWDN